jgi:hypothetical protein
MTNNSEMRKEVILILSKYGFESIAECYSDTDIINTITPYIKDSSKEYSQQECLDQIAEVLGMDVSGFFEVADLEKLYTIFTKWTKINNLCK